MLVYKLKPGYGWNPLKPYRNMVCPCGSGKKIKRCHGVYEVLPLQDVNTSKTWIRNMSALGVIQASQEEMQPVPQEVLDACSPLEKLQAERDSGTPIRESAQASS